MAGCIENGGATDDIRVAEDDGLTTEDDGPTDADILGGKGDGNAGGELGATGELPGMEGGRDGRLTTHCDTLTLLTLLFWPLCWSYAVPNTPCSSKSRNSSVSLHKGKPVMAKSSNTDPLRTPSRTTREVDSCSPERSLMMLATSSTASTRSSGSLKSASVRFSRRSVKSTAGLITSVGTMST